MIAVPVGVRDDIDLAMTTADPSAGRGNAARAAYSDPVHDFAWHRRYRSRLRVRLVDVAVLLAWSAFVAWILLHH
jgi:hypothetical protein